MQCFKSPGSAERFLSIIPRSKTTLHVPRYLAPRRTLGVIRERSIPDAASLYGGLSPNLDFQIPLGQIALSNGGVIPSHLQAWRRSCLAPGVRAQALI